MARIPPINAGALKITFPANLPRNEKDLICMLLAGRLKDLWRGKLLCAQLAIDDLIKDATGVSGLGELRSTLNGLKGAVNEFRNLSGYDRILSGVNSALGQVSNVFSLGGLCPSPVRAPKIPDLLGALNSNLFGQANNILNALARASNPKLCLGGGPKGFGVDWSQVDGSLRNLKNAIDRFKSTGSGSSIIAAFVRNLKNQQRRLNAEIRRLNKNLSDPLGINNKKNTVAAIKRAKTSSDDFPVKDKHGIEYPSPTKMMMSGEADLVLGRTAPIYADPVKYEVVPVIDYCGRTTGFEKKIITGDPDYMGWDTLNTNLNLLNPTVNPRAEFAQYAYTFKEENGVVKVYNTAGEQVINIALERGQHYRLGFMLENRTLKFYNGGAVWTDGIKMVKEPDYGIGFESVNIDSVTAFSVMTVEADWTVSKEIIANPEVSFVRTYVPNTLTWRDDTGASGIITVTGTNGIAEEDKTYDVSTSAEKAWLYQIRDIVSDSFTSIDQNSLYGNRIYQMTTNITQLNGVNYSRVSEIGYGSGYSVIEDEGESAEFLNLNSVGDEGNKIVKIVQQLTFTVPYKYLVVKKYVNDNDGLLLNQINCYVTQNLGNEIEGYELIASLKYDEPVVLLNDIKLPYTDFCDYKLTLPNNSKLENKDELSIEKESGEIIVNLTANRNASECSVNEFVYRSEIAVNDLDPDRGYVYTNPAEQRTYIYFKGSNGFEFSTDIVWTRNTDGTPLINNSSAP